MENKSKNNSKEHLKHKIYLKDMILSYNKINNYLNTLILKHSDKISKKILGYTNFKFPLSCYIIGKGSKHVLLFANTHGNEIITSHFLLEFILTLVENTDIYMSYAKDFTFHFIPLLNPEGYVISSSIVTHNTYLKSQIDIEKLCKKYLELYNLDDKIASQKIYMKKNFTTVLESSSNHIPYYPLKKSVDSILKSCKLDASFLPIWAANGMGFDINSNSIHKFKQILLLRKSQKVGPLRYNDIPVTIPSPICYPGRKAFDSKCPENIILYKYIKKLYTMNSNKNIDDSLCFIFSYHSTGGEVYGYPDSKISTTKQVDIHLNAMNKYCDITNYRPIDENLKYGVMDFYRASLEGVVSLSIELSNLNANPIGPYSNLRGLKKEFILNKEAIFNTIQEDI
ncbi:MAG: M14 family zinc carboxypeptidase [Clostridia bacterium]